MTRVALDYQDSITWHLMTVGHTKLGLDEGFDHILQYVGRRVDVFSIAELSTTISSSSTAKKCVLFSIYDAFNFKAQLSSVSNRWTASRRILRTKSLMGVLWTMVTVTSMLMSIWRLVPTILPRNHCASYVLGNLLLAYQRMRRTHRFHLPNWERKASRGRLQSVPKITSEHIPRN